MVRIVVSMQGFLPSFFHRLDPSTPSTLSPEAWADTIKAEILLLMNAHATERLFHPLCAPKFQKPWGQTLDPTNTITWRLWEQELEHWLLTLEPRLKRLKVTVQAFHASTQKADILLRAEAHKAKTSYTFSFPTQVVVSTV